MGRSQTSSNLRSANRFEWVDVARGLGIVLVVIGHVNIGLLMAGLGGSMTAVLYETGDWIYSFHMAVFFILAGMFAEGSLRRHGPGGFAREKTSRLLYPYFVWGLLQTSVHAAVSGATNTTAEAGTFLQLLYNPPMQFWFLPCLLFGLLTYAAVVKCGGGAFTFAGVALALAMIVLMIGPAPTSPLGRYGDNILYLATGVVAARPLMRFGTIPTRLLLLMAVVFGAGSIILVREEVRWPRPGSYSLPLVGSVFLFAVAVVLVRSGLPGRLMAVLGRLSMEIYVAHVLAYAGIRILLVKVGVTSVGFHWVAGVVVGVAGPILLVYVCRLVGFKYLFSPPSWRSTPVREG